MFQAQIDKQSRSFSCNVCHSKQGYSRVFAKSNIAKDLRPLVAEYNAKGVAETEASKDEPNDLTQGHAEHPNRETYGELGEQRVEEGAIGRVWDEFRENEEASFHVHDDFDVYVDEDNLADNQQQIALLPTKRSAACSEWELDSDARRIEKQRARFTKPPREKRAKKASRRAVAAGGSACFVRNGSTDQRVDQGKEVWTTTDLDRSGVDVSNDKESYHLENQATNEASNQRAGAGARAKAEEMKDSAWGEYLSD